MNVLNILSFINLFLIIHTSNTIAQGTWEKIKTPVDVDLRRVVYLDSLNLWVAGDSGVIMHSSDKGDTWGIQNNQLQQRIHDIFFLNDSLGWALTWTSDGIDYQSQILRTTNGGTNWSSSDYRHSNIILNTIFFTDSVHGWICGEPFDFSYTDNGGSEWFPANIDTGSFAYFKVSELQFSTPQYGFAVGGVHDAVGVVWRTTNGGELWKAFGIGPDLFLDFVFLDSVNTLALTAELEGFYPTGKLRFNIVESSWEYVDLPQYSYVTGLDKRTPGEIWGTLGNVSRSFIVSSDSLRVWNSVTTPDSLIAYDICFADSLHGIAAAENGYILRYIPQEPVDVEDIKWSQSPNEFYLEQNYPNPFNPVTTIKFTLPFSANIRVTVYNILGEMVAELIEDYRYAGVYSVDFNAADFNSGIYIYELSVNGVVKSRKMLLLK